MTNQEACPICGRECEKYVKRVWPDAYLFPMMIIGFGAYIPTVCGGVPSRIEIGFGTSHSKAWHSAAQRDEVVAARQKEQDENIVQMPVGVCFPPNLHVKDCGCFDNAKAALPTAAKEAGEPQPTIEEQMAKDKAAVLLRHSDVEEYFNNEQQVWLIVHKTIPGILGRGNTAGEAWANAKVKTLQAELSMPSSPAATGLEDLLINHEDWSGVLNEIQVALFNDRIRAAYGRDRERWVGVKERLPEEGVLVLISFFNGSLCAARLKEDKWRCFDRVWQRYLVDFWQPLPAPPKEG